MQFLRQTAARILAGLLCVLALAGCGDRESRHLERADSHYDERQYEKAKIEYMNALRLDAANVHVIARLGAIWTDQGSPVRALPFLYKVRELAPSDLASRHRLATTYLTLGQLAEARKEATAILLADPGNEDAVLLLAETAQTPADAAATRKHIESLPEHRAAVRHTALAVLLQRESNWEGAEREANAALAVDADYVPARVASAVSSLAKGDAQAARQEFAAASALSPARSPHRLRYAAFLADHAGAAEAAAVADALVSEAPDYLPAWIFKGRLALNAGRHDDALECLQHVFSIDHNNPEGGLLEAEVRTAAGNPGEALKILERLQARFPNLPTVVLELARAHDAAGAADRAVEVLDQAVNAHPDFSRAILYSADLSIRSGRPEAAVNALTSLLRRSPKLREARSLLAAALERAGRKFEAVEVLRNLIADEPDDPSLKVRLGALLRELDATDEARRSLENASALNPSDEEALAQLAALDRASGNSAEAFARIDRFLAANPESARARYLKGTLHIEQNDPAAAAHELTKAIELDASLVEAREALVRVLASSGDIAGALGVLEAALRRSPRDTGILRSMAILRAEQKDYKGLLADFQAILEAEPDALDALNNMAALYCEQFQDTGRALEAARRARSLRPGVAVAGGIQARQEAAAVADTLAWILYRRGEFREAFALATEAAGPLDNHAEVLFHLGMIAYRNGELDTARDALDKALTGESGVAFRGEGAATLERARSLPALSAEELEALIQSDPGDAVVRVKLGDVLKAAGRFAEAADAYQAAIRLFPDLFPAVAGLAELYCGPLRDDTRSAALTERAGELSPDHPRTTVLRGFIALHRNDFSTAYRHLREGAAGKSGDPAVLESFAFAAYAMGRLAEARDAMQRVLAISPEHQTAKTFLRLTSDESAVTLEAEAAAALAAEIAPDPARMILAAAQAERGERQAAVTTYRELLRSLPDSALVRKSLAAVLSMDPDSRDEAFALATQAREALPDDPGVARTLGGLAYHRGDHRYAIQLLQESSRSIPLDATGLYYLGMAQVREGNRSDGQVSLTLARRAGLSRDLSEEADRELKDTAGH